MVWVLNSTIFLVLESLMQVPWWLWPDSGKAYQPVTIVKLVLIKQSGTEFFKIFFFLKVEVNFNCSNVLEAWSYMNDPSKLDDPISKKQFFGLKFSFE